jgi:hypothetical protein
MSTPYYSDEVQILFGVPVQVPGIIEADYTLKDFNRVEISYNEGKFNIEKGIFREKIITYDPSDIANINIYMNYGSIDNEFIELLFKAQEFGVIGLPLSIKFAKKIEDKKKRKSYIAPVAVLTKNTNDDFAAEASERLYQFKTTYLQTFYT